jgi:hypothetical protein
VLFKTHREQVQPLCEIIFTQILPKVLDPNLTPKMHQFGIFLIDDIVEHLGYTLAGPKFADFAKALSLYASNKVCFVRQAAVYGIGVLAGNTPKVPKSMQSLGSVPPIRSTVVAGHRELVADSQERE